MHTIFHGVVKTLFIYWFEKNNSVFSLKTKMQEINHRLLSIRPPSYVSCTPRSIFDWKIWRAHEFLNFILFYALMVFSNALMVFSNGVILLYLYQEKIEKENLPLINKILINFVEDLPKLYDNFILTSGIHELLHLVEQTNQLGPLNTFNCFQFEELNRKIANLIKGQNLLGEEFIKLFSICQNMSNISLDLNSDSKVGKFIDKYFWIKSSNRKKLSKKKALSI